MIDKEWYVYRYNINKKRIEKYNIFNHGSFAKDLEKIIEEDPFDIEERIKRILLYYFWSKAEWEIIISPFIGEKTEAIKIDVYDQVMNNWDRFIDYLLYKNEEYEDEENNSFDIKKEVDENGCVFSCPQRVDYPYCYCMDMLSEEDFKNNAGYYRGDEERYYYYKHIGKLDSYYEKAEKEEHRN